MSSLGVILARGASKRLPRKNARPLCGVPLLAWTCKAAAASRLDRVIVSTEDEELASIAMASGVEVPFRRPLELAADFARDVDIVLHALGNAEKHFQTRYENVVLIQATTPFVRPEHLDECLSHLRSGGFGCVFSVRKAEDHPRWVWRVDERGHAHSFIGTELLAEEQHSQNLASAYYPTGAAWAINADQLRAQDRIYCEPLGVVEMPWENAVDIDDKRDWIVAEAVAKAYGIHPIGDDHPGGTYE